MESWKSGSQMTRTIDLRHWAQRGDIVPRCGDRTFSAFEGSVPMTVSIGVRKRCLWRRRHTSICGAMFWFLMERPRGGVASPGPPASLGPRGVIPKQDALNQSPPVGRVPDSAAPVGAI